MDLVVATDGVSANMASTPVQDSAFLCLPLEIRYEIYGCLIHLRNTKTLSMDNTRDPAGGLDSVTILLGVSQQIRTEVHCLVHAVTTLEAAANATPWSTIEPHYIAVRRARLEWKRECHRATDAFRYALAELSKDDMKAPHQLKFWKVCIPFANFYGHIEHFADVNLRARVVCIREASGNQSSSDRVSDHWPAKREAFTNAMRSFTEQDGFKGISVADMSLFMEKVDWSQVHAFPP